MSSLQTHRPAAPKEGLPAEPATGPAPGSGSAAPRRAVSAGADNAAPDEAAPAAAAPDEAAPAPEGEVALRARFYHRPRWNGDGGLRQLLNVATPLILSFAVHAVNNFVDRLMLAHYAPEHFGAALQGAIIWWTLMMLPLGILGYVGTIIAQYTGSGENARVGASLWQALWLVVPAGLLIMVTLPFSGTMFGWIGHEGDLPALERVYYDVLSWGTIAFLVQSVLSSFYTGRGRTWFVLGINAFCVAINILLNWWFIFHGGPGDLVPRGIGGAGIATVLATLLSCVIFAAAIFSRRNDAVFRTRRDWRWNGPEMARLLRFGVPAGIHGLVDMIGITTFALVAGKFGPAAQIATNMAFNINGIVFIPAIGIHIAVQVLTGQAMGARQPEHAERTTSLALMIAFAYFAVVAVTFATFPQPLIEMYRGEAATGHAEFAMAATLAPSLLMFVAFYSMFDAVALVICGTLKGAGDTKFVMAFSAALSISLLVLPLLWMGGQAATMDAHTGLYLCWGILALWLMVSATVFGLRYRNGGWRLIRVLDDAPAAASGAEPEAALAGAAAAEPASA